MDYNNFKITLADVLSLVAIVIFSFICFLGMNFLTIGDYQSSMYRAILIGIGLGVLSLVLKFLKSTNRNFKSTLILEWGLLIIFLVSAFFTFTPFNHYFTVLQQKSEIQNIVGENIGQIEEMFIGYKKYANQREEAYSDILKMATAAKNINPGQYRNYGFVDNISDEKQIENKIFTLRAQLLPSNFEGTGGIQDVATKWLDDYKKNINSQYGFTFGITDVFSEVPLKAEEWKSELKSLSTYRIDNEDAKDFDYNLTFNTSAEKLSNVEGPTILGLIVAIPLYLLMLVSWYVAPRNTKNPYTLLSFLKTKRRHSSYDNDIDINY